MNTGLAHILFAGLRAAGHKNDAGQVFGGIYYPAHTKNGKFVPARFEANFFLNKRGWTNDAGAKQEGKSDVIRIVVWNSKKAAPGKGRADHFAKIISVGKELTAECELNTFLKRIFLNGNVVVNPATNQPIEYQAVSFRISGEVNYGDDAENTLKREIAAYKGQPNFGSRPPQWNVLGHVDNTAWKDVVLPARMASVYNGTAATYGYARVLVPEGATVVTAESLAAHNAGQPAGGDAPTDAAAALQGNNAAAGSGDEYPL